MKKIQTLLIASLAIGVVGLATTSHVQALECSVLPPSICDKDGDEGLANSGIWALLILGLQIMTAGVGIVAVGAIVFAGIMYSSAQGDAGQTKKAIEIIRNTVIGLFLYMLMFAIVNFLIPGGILTREPTQTAPSGVLA